MYISDKKFHDLALKGVTPGGEILRKQLLNGTVKAGSNGKRTLDFIISTEAVDRMNDVISLKGWELDNYKKNPVVLFAHDSHQVPVARAENVRIDHKNKQLKSKAVFPEEGVHPLSDTLYSLYTGGFMKATSVGFRPLEYELALDEDGEWLEGREWGINFIKQELLEYSLVPVPANQEALQLAVDKGLQLSPLKGWVEETLDSWGSGEKNVPMTRKSVEGLYKSLGGTVMKASDFEKAADRLRRENIKRIKELSKEQEPEEQDKTVISYASAHKGGTPKADEDSSWDGSGEVSKAEVEDLLVMCAWREDKAKDELTKGDFKFPHHRAEDKVLVWRGVSNAAARLPQAKIPEDERAGVRTHLGKHYKEFDKEPPWEAEQAGMWKEYCAVSQKLIENSTDPDIYTEARDLCVKLFGEDIADDVIGVSLDFESAEDALENITQEAFEEAEKDEGEITEAETEAKKELIDQEDKDPTETREEIVLEDSSNEENNGDPLVHLDAFVKAVDSLEASGGVLEIKGRRANSILQNTSDILKEYIKEDVSEDIQGGGGDLDSEDVFNLLFNSEEGQRFIEATVTQELRKAQGRLD